MTSAPRTWVVGETVTAALMNQEIRDQLNSFFGAWSTYPVVWSATGAPAIGNGTLLGRYLKVGRTVQCHIDLICGSTTTYGSGSWSFSLPATASATGTGSRVGNAHALASFRFAGHNIISPTATDTSPFFPDSSVVPVTRLAPVASGLPFTWANGNQLRQTFTYEAAS